jgi:hypothetical protein
MLRPWNPTKAEIEGWLRTKELEFSQKDNRNPSITPRKYLDKYVFTDLHKVFFCDFPHLLQEWILRLKDNHVKNRIRQLDWTPVQVEQLQQVNNKFTRAVNFWLDQYCGRLHHRVCSRHKRSHTTQQSRNFYVDPKEGTFDHCILLLKYFYIKKV